MGKTVPHTSRWLTMGYMSSSLNMWHVLCLLLQLTLNKEMLKMA
uniref:Zinc finger BED domain-containing protein DAYSLEEPER n=1 Tax=Rhizophora mucronata TaxID=61149 RepID=A0A2P2JIZ1_RHIMU